MSAVVARQQSRRQRSRRHRRRVHSNSIFVSFLVVVVVGLLRVGRFLNRIVKHIHLCKFRRRPVASCCMSWCWEL